MKNVGGPYLPLFVDLIPKAFPEAFRALRDENSRKNFVRTLDTWATIIPPGLMKSIQGRSFGTSSHIGQKQEAPALPPAHAPPPRPAPHMAPPAAVLPRSPVDPYYGGAPYMHPSTIAPYSSRRPQPPRINRLLEDLYKEMTVPPQYYDERNVAGIMFHVCSVCYPRNNSSHLVHCL